MAATAFQSLNAAINSGADFQAISSTIKGLSGLSGNSHSIIPGQSVDYLNGQLTDTLTGLQAASKLRDTNYAAGLQTTYLKNMYST